MSRISSYTNKKKHHTIDLCPLQQSMLYLTKFYTITHFLLCKVLETDLIHIEEVYTRESYINILNSVNSSFMSKEEALLNLFSKKQITFLCDI